MFLFPAIDLRRGQVVRLHQGDYGQEKTYGCDPLEQALTFQTAGSTWLHIVDLDGARSGAMTQLDVIRHICENTKLKVEVGGGVRSVETIDQLLSIGVTRVILGTAALQQWDWFEKLVHMPAYHGKLVLDLGASGGKLTVSGWEKQIDVSPTQIAQRVTDWPLAAIVYTDVAVDGTMKGPNLEATQQMAATTKVPIVASGGVGTLDHLRALRRLPIQGAIVGRALYENRFTIDEALAVMERGSQPAR